MSETPETKTPETEEMGFLKGLGIIAGAVIGGIVGLKVLHFGGLLALGAVGAVGYGGYQMSEGHNPLTKLFSLVSDTIGTLKSAFRAVKRGFRSADAWAKEQEATFTASVNEPESGGPAVSGADHSADFNAKAVRAAAAEQDVTTAPAAKKGAALKR